LSWNKKTSAHALFSLQTIGERKSNGKPLPKGKAYDKPVLVVTPWEENTGVTPWISGDAGDWSAAKYLVAEVYGFDNYSGVIDLEFFKETMNGTNEKIAVQDGQVAGSNRERHWLTCLMGIMPKVKTKLVFPLSYLDAQKLFVPRHPRQLKGTVNKNRLDPKDITKVVLRFGPFLAPHFTQTFELASVALLDEEPEAYGSIDKKVVYKLGNGI
jgi:hypothetical protein